MPASAEVEAANPAKYEIDVDDVAYLRHGETTLLARMYKPRGAGPFPMMIDLHGGAWCNGDRHNDKVLCEALARTGIVVAAIDFRQPPEATYPDVMADINFSTRWLKANAGQFKGDASNVGMVGISSGGQQAMLAAMRPADPRYTAINSPETASFDATVGCVVLCWPVIDPLGRYQYGHELVAAGVDVPPNIPSALPSHDKYWGTEAAMAEGSPLRILETGEAVALPPVLYLQGTADRMHPRAHLDRFVKLYSERSGSIDLALYDQEAEGFITRTPRLPEHQTQATQRIISFVHSQLS